MIVDRDYLLFENFFQTLQVHHKASYRIDLTRYRHLQGVVMSMPVFVGAFTEDTFVFLRAPCLNVVEVGGGELSFAGQQDHLVE